MCGGGGGGFGVAFWGISSSTGPALILSATRTEKYSAVISHGVGGRGRSEIVSLASRSQVGERSFLLPVGEGGEGRAWGRVSR